MARHPLSIEDLLTQVKDSGCGGLVVFAGTVRDHNDGKKVESVTYEAEESMAEKALGRIYAAMLEKVGEGKCALLHRLGTVRVGEASVLIAAASEHRAEAFAAVRNAIEAVKHEVTIWKKEVYGDGTSAWLDGHSLCVAAEGDQPTKG